MPFLCFVSVFVVVFEHNLSLKDKGGGGGEPLL